MLFEGRKISLTSLALAAAITYGLTLEVEARGPLHGMFSALSILFALVNFNHAGIRGLGEHLPVSRQCRNIGIVFGPVWALAVAVNIWAVSGRDGLGDWVSDPGRFQDCSLSLMSA